MTAHFFQLTATIFLLNDDDLFTRMMTFVMMVMMMVMMFGFTFWRRVTVTTTSNQRELLSGQLLQNDVLCRKFFLFKDRKHLMFPFKRNYM